MRLLVVNVFYAPQSIGGATRVVEDNIRDLNSSHGIESIGVFCSLVGGREYLESRNYMAGPATVMAVTAKTTPKGDFLISDVKMQAQFEAFVDSFQPDIIHFHCVQRLTSDVCLVAKRRNIPYLITMHDGWWISDRQFLVNETGEIEAYNYADVAETERGLGRGATTRMEALLPALEGASRLLTVSNKFAGIVRAAGLDRITTLENGASPIEVLPKKGSDKPVIGYLAGAAHFKGYHLLKATLMRGTYSSFRLIVIDHSLKQHKSYREDWGKTEVLRIGFYPQEQVSELYQLLNIVIVPSIWPESFGLVAREAMMSGCWLIASDRGAASDDVDEGINGHRFEPGKQGDLDRVLSLIEASPETYLRAAPPTEIRTCDDQAEELAKLYREILSERS